MKIHDLVDEFRRSFQAQGTEERARFEKKYLKSDLEFLGVPVPVIRKTAKAFKRRHKDLALSEVMSVVDALWLTDTHELRTLAIAILDGFSDLLDSGHLETVEELLRQSNTWAHVDWLSTKLAGTLVERYPELEKVLKRWSKDGNFWIRRAAMLALHDPLRAGAGNFGLFESFAADMVEEKEFFIRKAIGWILREVSKKRPQLTYGFLDRHIEKVSGLTLREGSKYLPAELKESLMKRYRERA